MGSLFFSEFSLHFTITHFFLRSNSQQRKQQLSPSRIELWRFLALTFAIKIHIPKNWKLIECKILSKCVGAFSTLKLNVSLTSPLKCVPAHSKPLFSVYVPSCIRGMLDITLDGKALYEYPQCFKPRKLDFSTELWRTFQDKTISLPKRNHEILLSPGLDFTALKQPRENCQLNFRSNFNFIRKKTKAKSVS